MNRTSDGELAASPLAMPHRARGKRNSTGAGALSPQPGAPSHADRAPFPPPSSDSARFTLGDWLVDVRARRLHRGQHQVVLEPRVMAVLVQLCRHPQEVISAETLLQACWLTEPMGDNPVHKAIAVLRRALEDNAGEPRYIETIRKQGYRLLAPAGVLSAQGRRSHHGAWRGQSPFRGLEPFGPQHAGVFFGRDAATALLLARLTAQWRRGDPLVVLLGPSGSGKTSLVQAGLLPALLMPATVSAAAGQPAPMAGVHACTAATLDLAALGDLDPWAALAGALLDWDCGGTPLLSGHSISSLAQALQHRSDEVLHLLRVGLEASHALVGGRAVPERPPLLVLDRLEALLQHMAPPVAAAFLASVERLVRSRLVLVLAVCRNDFYPSLAQHPVLMACKEHGGHLDLAPPDASAVALMIRLPAQAAGLTFGTDSSGLYRLDDRLCADAMQAPDALPLLQYTLQALYVERRAGDLLAWEDYESLGGLEGAVGRRAEALLAALPLAQQEALNRLLPRLVGHSGDEAAPTGRWLPAADCAGADEHALVQAFVEARLLVADHVGGVTGYRVAHEALLRRWPRVTAWIAQHRTALACLEELRPWVRRWLQDGKAATLLLPSGVTLWQASGLLADARPLLGEDERTFVRASLARLQRQKRRRLAALTGALTLAAAAAVAAMGYAHQARVGAEHARQSQQLASFMLGELADRLRPIGRLELLGRIGEQGLQVLGRPGTGGDTPQDLLQRARALVVIGEVNSSRGRGQTHVAVAALEQARKLLEPLERSAGGQPAAYYRTLGASVFWLGQIAFDRGDFSTALREMGSYREVNERWQHAHPNDPQARVELGYALNSLGSIAVRQGAWPEADRWFKASLALKQAGLERQPDDGAVQEAVASSRTWLGLVSHVQGQPARAMALYDAARSTQVALLNRHPDELTRLWDLGTLDVRRAEALNAMGRRAIAVRTMEEALARLRRAEAHDPSNRRWTAERLHAEAGLLLLQADAGDLMRLNRALRQLQQQLAESGAADTDNGWLHRETRTRLAVLEALLAGQRDGPAGSAAAADRTHREAQHQLRELLDLRPGHWQGRELQARLVLMSLHTPTSPSQCAQARDDLQPAVEAGQAGVVLEAWITASRCAGSPAVSGPWMSRLTSGGYRPLEAAIPQPNLDKGLPS